MDFLAKREVRHRIVMTEQVQEQVVDKGSHGGRREKAGKGILGNTQVQLAGRVSTYYIGLPMVRKNIGCTEAGKLIKMPSSVMKL
ncbi:hypothetical protein HanXRQr2_Chr10g0442401 [Helianthus annuus]|uniref:Uncharacterized protein n=1 Tax=Helianthus annuus TaxID=4232 RepID=A0A9K3N4K6_HELAN|nr:hypothetical protein HanXRQr2_Chr10g0442401 [Helianthus annuus]KAJ0521954.1 hypothetical protein HanIR_Chr10g0476981 [Helianthus annuus]KAJ0530075.1 hypothetical protein HanHA89_Chr10g0385461 [Helianthus annuus]KAJ0696931.1 hypothetical protein HanLR1_Chr10g0362981 [Helianthus annuus]